MNGYGPLHLHPSRFFHFAGCILSPVNPLVPAPWRCSLYRPTSSFACVVRALFRMYSTSPSLPLFLFLFPPQDFPRIFPFSADSVLSASFLPISPTRVSRLRLAPFVCPRPLPSIATVFALPSARFRHPSTLHNTPPRTVQLNSNIFLYRQHPRPLKFAASFPPVFDSFQFDIGSERSHPLRLPLLLVFDRLSGNTSVKDRKSSLPLIPYLFVWVTTVSNCPTKY